MGSRSTILLSEQADEMRQPAVLAKPAAADPGALAIHVQVRVVDRSCCFPSYTMPQWYLESRNQVSTCVCLAIQRRCARARALAESHHGPCHSEIRV